MNNTTSLRIELGIDARKIMQHVQFSNDQIEQDIQKGIELALKDISEKGNFIEMVRENVKIEINKVVNESVFSWDTRQKIKKLIEEKIGEKINEYADNIAEQVVKNLK